MMPITINAKTSKKSFKIDSIVPNDICDADIIKIKALKIKTKKEINKANFFSILFFPFTIAFLNSTLKTKQMTNHPHIIPPNNKSISNFSIR